MNKRISFISKIKIKSIINELEELNIDTIDLNDFTLNELLYEYQDNISFLEKIIQYENVKILGIENFKTNPDVANLFCKYKKSIYFWELKEDELFRKYDDKLLIEKILYGIDIKNATRIIKTIKNHNELLDILVNNGMVHYINLVNDSIINYYVTLKDNKYPIEKYINRDYVFVGILKCVKDKILIIKICEKYNKQELIRSIIEKSFLDEIEKDLKIKLEDKQYYLNVINKKDLENHDIEIKELLTELKELFINDNKSDKYLIELMIKSYYQALLLNTTDVKKIVAKLIEIKKDYSDEFILQKGKCGSQQNSKITLNEYTFAPVIIFHEIGHLIHKNNGNYVYYTDLENAIINIRNQKDLTKKFEQFKEKFFNINNYAKNKPDEYFKLYFENFKSDYIKKLKELNISDKVINIILAQTITKDLFLKKKKEIFCNQLSYRYMIIKQPLLVEASDILDAVFQGEMKQIENMYGHGREYYSKMRNCIIEIVACYFAIMCTVEKDVYLKELKYLFGNEFVDIMERFCNNLLELNVNKKDKSKI